MGLVGGLGLAAVACNGTLPFGLGGNGVALFLPADVSLDVSELPDTNASSSKNVNSALSITGVTAYDRTLLATGAITHEFQRVAHRVMALGGAIRNDFTSPDQTQIADDFMVNGVDVSYRADFAAFDIDGDGTPDGSGQATVEPVAVRIWVDRGSGFERFFCALVTKRPSGSNLGAGTIIVKPSAANGNDFSDLRIKLTWDRTDPSHKWNEAFIKGRLRQVYAMSRGRQRVDVRTAADGTIEKTVRSTNSLTNNPFGFDTVSFSTHFLRGSGAALISALATGGSAQMSFSNVCINLTDKSATTGGQCDAFDTQDVAFLDPAVGDETDFPADFPSEPTFTPPPTNVTNTTTGTTGTTSLNGQSPV